PREVPARVRIEHELRAYQRRVAIRSGSLRQRAGHLAERVRHAEPVIALGEQEEQVGARRPTRADGRALPGGVELHRERGRTQPFETVERRERTASREIEE